MSFTEDHCACGCPWKGYDTIEAESFEPPLPVFPPEQVNTYQPLRNDDTTIDDRSDTFARRIPRMLRTMEVASREPDGTALKRNVGMPKRNLLPNDPRIDNV